MKFSSLLKIFTACLFLTGFIAAIEVSVTPYDGPSTIQGLFALDGTGNGPQPTPYPPSVVMNDSGASACTDFEMQLNYLPVNGQGACEIQICDNNNHVCFPWRGANIGNGSTLADAHDLSHPGQLGYTAQQSIKVICLPNCPSPEYSTSGHPVEFTDDFANVPSFPYAQLDFQYAPYLKSYLQQLAWYNKEVALDEANGTNGGDYPKQPVWNHPSTAPITLSDGETVSFSLDKSYASQGRVFCNINKVLPIDFGCGKIQPEANNPSPTPKPETKPVTPSPTITPTKPIAVPISIPTITAIRPVSINVPSKPIVIKVTPLIPAVISKTASGSPVIKLPSYAVKGTYNPAAACYSRCAILAQVNWNKGVSGNDCYYDFDSNLCVYTPLGLSSFSQCIASNG
ncbi:Uncharacterised protein [uncultured archaeon]|nr:Uncharacterised protein [uncultured archaeon]